jgi:transcriptional regulator with XRE-family HTH domain
VPRPDLIDRHVGRRVRMRRLVVGISQEKLGEALGITFQQIHKYERGTDRIGAGRLQQIAKALGVSIKFFFEGLPHGRRRDVVASDGSLANFLSTPEGVRLTRAFIRVANPKVRRQFISLVKAIAEDESV